jgi:hypothetical protein
MVRTNKSSCQQFYICCFAYVILFLTVLLSDRLYIDDIGRSLYGYFGWTQNGRPLADVVVYLLNLGTPLINIAPLPQLLSIAIIAYAAMNIISKYHIDKPYMAALCTLPLAGQPYYLENMSYCFDSPTMALGILLSINGAFYINNSNIPDKLKASLCILFTLMLYQAALSVLFVTYIFIVLREMSSQYKPIKLVINKIMSFSLFTLVPFFIYFLITRIITLGPYATTFGKVLSLSKFQIGLYNNIMTYISILFNDWKGNFVGAVMVVVVLSAFITFIISVINNESNIASKISRVISILLVLPLIVLASYFPQIVLEQPIWVPRTFIGIGAILTLSCLQLYSFCSATYSSDSRYKKIIMLLPICFLSYALLVVSFSFAKATSSQKDFESYRLTRLGGDAEEIIQSHNINSVGFIGSIGQNPLLQNTMRKFPLIGRLVPLHINYNWRWGHMQLRSMGISLNPIDLNEDERKAITNKLPIIDKSLYSIYAYDGKMIVKFKR